MNRHVRSTAFSERRLNIATGMPKSDNFKKVAANAVVNEISNAPKMKPSDEIRARYFNSCSNARLIDQISQSAEGD